MNLVSQTRDRKAPCLSRVAPVWTYGGVLGSRASQLEPSSREPLWSRAAFGVGCLACSFMEVVADRGVWGSWGSLSRVASEEARGSAWVELFWISAHSFR